MQKNDRTHFIVSPGSLRRRDNNIVYTKYDEEGNPDGPPRPLPIHGIDELYLLAKTDLDSETLCFLSDSNIVVHVFNHRGGFRGNFFPNTPNSVNKSGYVLIRQLEAFKDAEHRLHIARQITHGHLYHAYANMQRYGVSGDLQLEPLLNEVEKSPDIAALMGIEGSFQKQYLESWNGIIKNQKSFKFTQRTRRPPTDKINLLISYLNTRIYNICLSEIYKTELDPRIGYLHEPNFRALSLHLDLAEIFKPLLGDPIIFTLLNKDMLTPKDFSTDHGIPVLKREGVKTVEMAVINKMTESVALGKQHLTWRQIIRREANRLKRCICETSEYVPYGCE